MWQSHDHSWHWSKIVISPPIPQLRIFARNFFHKIGVEASYLGYTSVRILLPLSYELWNQIRDLYSKLTLYKLWVKGETPLVGVTSFQRQHLCGESWSSTRTKPTTPAQVDSKPFVIFPPNILLHIVCILNIFTADWGCNSRLTKEAISSVMFFMFNI